MHRRVSLSVSKRNGEIGSRVGLVMPDGRHAYFNILLVKRHGVI